MAIFCADCGKQLGFFASKKRVVLEGVEQVYCASCDPSQESAAQMKPAPLGAKPAASPESLHGSLATGKSDEPGEREALTEKIRAYQKALPGDGKWAKLVSAVCEDMVLYGPSPEGIMEGFDLLEGSIRRFREPDEEGGFRASLASYAATLMRDTERARQVARGGLLLLCSDVVKMELFLVLAVIEGAAGSKEKAHALIEKALALNLPVEALEKVAEAKITVESC